MCESCWTNGSSRPIAQISAQAFTHEEALKYFRGLIGAPPSRDRISEAVSITRDEFLQLDHFFQSATRRLKRARHQAKELKHPQLEVPGYPSNTNQVDEVLRRLSVKFTSDGVRPSP
jgi:hypothetical protein